MAANGDQERNEQPQPQGEPAGGGGFALSGRTLGIAGGGAAALVVVIAVVVLLAAGVFGGGGGGASGGKDWLPYVPRDATGVAIADNRALFGGDVAEDFVEYLEDEDGGSSEKTYDFVDVDEDDLIIHASVFDDSFDDTLEILQGNFDFDIIREELEDGRDCEDDDYRGFELWECPGQEYPAVALFEKDKYVVLAAQRQSDLEDLLTYKSREPEKLANADDSDLTRLLDQTGGWLQFAVLGDACLINRCEGLAFALGKSGDSAEIPASYALLFSSERAATAAEGDIEIDDLLEEWFASLDLDLDIGEVRTDGEFLVGDGTAEFVDPDDARSRSSNLGGRDGGSRGSEITSEPAATQDPRAVAPTPRPALAAAHPAQQQAPAAAQQAAKVEAVYVAMAIAPPSTPIPQAPALRRGEWLKGCANFTLEQTNQYLAGHEQIVEWDDAYQHCECWYGYLEDREGPPTVAVSDLLVVDLYWDAAAHCAGY